MPAGGRYWRRVFARYGDKVEVVQVQEFPEMPLAWSLYFLSRCNVRSSASAVSWWREATQRSYAINGIPDHVCVACAAVDPI